MAIDLSTVTVKLQATGTAQVKGAFGEIGKEAAKVKQSLVDLLSPTKAISGAIAGIGAGLSAAAVGGFLKSSIDEARDAEDKLVQLKQAVENSGASFKDWKETTDNAADGLEKVTRYSDEAARGALTTLISISGNVSGSIRNLGVTADLAAAKHLDLNAAAELVGKAMIGNTKALKKMGIEAKDGTDIMELLRQKFQGFAESDAQTLTGRLDQMSNAWDDVKEAIGDVILGTGDLSTKTNGLRDSLVDLKKYIEENGDKWREWAKNLLDPNWGPIKILNSIADAANRAGLALYGLRTGNFSKLDDYVNQKDFSDVTGGSSVSNGDNIAGVTVHASRVKDNTPGSGKKGKKEKEASPLATAPHVGITPSGDDRMATAQTGDVVSTDTIFGKMKEVKEDPMTKAANEAIQKRTEDIGKAIEDSQKKLSDTINGGFAQTLGDSIYNAFSAAFAGEGLGGIFKAFGKTVLAGVGSIFTQLGQTYLEYGGIMQALSALLPNPFTAGYAGLAIGAALIAMGSALGAVAHGGGGRGTATAGAFREANNGNNIVRLKFVDRNGAAASEVKAPVVVHATIIGVNDPTTNTAVKKMVENAGRR